MNDYEMLFSPGGLIPVNVETTGHLVQEVVRLREILKKIEYASRKDSLTESERLESVRIVLTREGFTLSNGERG
jgi:hypothetical protein